MIEGAKIAGEVGALLPDAVMTAAVLLVAQWFHRALGKQQETFATALQAVQSARDADRDAFREEIHRLVQSHERATGRVVEQLATRLDRVADTQRELAEAVARLSVQSSQH